jgi:hypothetical protein
VLVCGKAHLVGINAEAFFDSPKAEEPTADCHGKRVDHGCLPSRVVPDEQIEVWVEIECAVGKTVKILDCKMVNPHL